MHSYKRKKCTGRGFRLALLPPIMMDMRAPTGRPPYSHVTVAVEHSKQRNSRPFLGHYWFPVFGGNLYQCFQSLTVPWSAISWDEIKNPIKSIVIRFCAFNRVGPVRGLRGGRKKGVVWWVGQERLGPSYFFILWVIGPLNSLLWYVPFLRYIWSSGPLFCFCKNK